MKNLEAKPVDKAEAESNVERNVERNVETNVENSVDIVAEKDDEVTKDQEADDTMPPSFTTITEEVIGAQETEVAAETEKKQPSGTQRLK